jgi:uncharacterized protein (DUF305 family)
MKGNTMARSAVRSVAIVLTVVAAIALSACSVSITSNDTASAEASAEASAAATPDASEAAVIDQEIYNFCVNDAQGSMDFLSVLGDQATQAIDDGIAQSIEQQQMTPAQAESCTKAWVDTLAENGITYVPGGAGSAAASPAASPGASPAAS